MDQDVQCTAPSDHPCYAGHFPGNPIVPGVLLLDLVVAAVGHGAPRGIGNVKFHRALRPGEAFTLRYRVAGTQLSFRCLGAEQLLAEGSLTLPT